MKFALVLAGLVGLTVAQTTTETTTAATATASLTPQQTCLADCDAADVNCRAACLGNPFPDEAQVNATTECAARCVQGNGTQEETEAYARCQADCVGTHYFSTGANFVGTATNGASGSASATGTNTAPASSNANPTATGGAAGESSAIATPASPTETGAAPAAFIGQVGTPFVGLVGFLVAAVAL